MTDAPSAASAGAPSLGAAGHALPRFLADPDLRIVGDRYFLFPTTDGTPGWESTAFRAYSSPDLREWTDHGDALRLGSGVEWAEAYAWAPASISRDGRHYLYFTADDHIGVAVASDPSGPFHDIGRPLVAPGDYAGRAIDPSIFVDADGSTYLLWGNAVAHIVRLGEDLVSFDPDAVHSWVPTEFREAVWMHRRGDVYYASWSVDDTRDPRYHVRYATAEGLTGPWTDRGVLIEQVPDRGIFATGHHSILNVPNTDDWVVAYHRFAVPDGDGFHREVVFDRLIHRADGLIEQVIPSMEPLRIPLHPHP